MSSLPPPLMSMFAESRAWRLELAGSVCLRVWKDKYQYPVSNKPVRLRSPELGLNTCFYGVGAKVPVLDREVASSLRQQTD
jgi:hypothetical protein